MKTACSCWLWVSACVCVLKEKVIWGKHWTFRSALCTQKCFYLQTSAVFVCRHVDVYVSVGVCMRCLFPWLASIKSHDKAVFGVVLVGGEASTCFTLLVVYVHKVILGSWGAINYSPDNKANSDKRNSQVHCEWAREEKERVWYGVSNRVVINSFRTLFRKNVS